PRHRDEAAGRPRRPGHRPVGAGRDPDRVRRPPAGGPRGACPDLGAPDPELQPDGRRIRVGHRGEAPGRRDQRRPRRVLQGLLGRVPGLDGDGQGPRGEGQGRPGEDRRRRAASGRRVEARRLEGRRDPDRDRRPRDQAEDDRGHVRGRGTVTAWTNRSGTDVRLLLVVAVALVLGLAAAGAWALTTNNDLESTRAALASTSGDLHAAKGELIAPTAALDATTADLAAARDAIKKDQAKATSLNFQIERKGACIAAQAANLAEIRRILALERVDFARTGSTSAWGRAHSAAQKAINLAIDD